MAYKIILTPSDTPDGQTGTWYCYTVRHDRTKIDWFQGVRQGTKKEIEKYLKETIRKRKNSAGVVDLDLCGVRERNIPSSL